MVVTASDLRERLTHYTPSATRDAYNAEVVTWTAGATVWAAVKERGGREVLVTDRPAMLVGYEVTIRDGVTVSHADRWGWGNKTLTVETVTPLQALGLIVMRCLEVVV